MVRSPEDRRGLPARSRCIAAVMASRSSPSLILSWFLGGAGTGEAGSLVPVGGVTEEGDPLFEPFTQRGGGERAGDFCLKLGDLHAEPADVGVGPSDVRAGR